MMKRALLVLVALLVGLLPVMAAAGLDPRTDSMGIYFDTAGNSTCLNAAPFAQFGAYLLLMNPANTTDGFECTVTITPTGGAAYFALANAPAGSGPIDVDSAPFGYTCGVAAPYVASNGAIVLVNYQFLLTAPGGLEFRLGAGFVPSLPGGLPIVTGMQGENAVLRRCEVTSCDVDLPVAVVNGICPQPCDLTPDPFDIVVDISTQAAGLQDSQIRAASSSTATDGYDGGIDIPKPTPPPGNYVAASFEHPSWSLGPRFAADVRHSYSPLTDYQVWPLMVETDRTGDVTLTFAPNFSTANDILLYLRDTQSGQFYNLFPSLSYVFTNNGLPNTYRFELIVGAAPVPPPLSPSSRALPAGWSMVGLPLVPSAGATVGNVIIDPAPGYAYAFDYTRATGYRNLASSTTIAQGTGYWLATDGAFDWTMTGTRDMDGVTVPLTRGWNLVGNANWFPGPFEGLRVIHMGSTYEWLAAAQMGLVSNEVQSFDPATGTYFDAVDLQPWHGYWINALEDNLSLRFYWGNFVELPKRLTAQKSAIDPDDPSWQWDLNLVDAADQRRTITIGMHANATAGFDPLYDKPQPPQSPAGGPLLMVNRSEWDLASGQAISRDLVGLNDEVVSWPVVLKSSNPGRAVLSWDPSVWPDGVDFQLYLPHENRVAVMSMRKQMTYALVLGSQSTQVVVRSPSFTSGVAELPTADYGVSVSPNPFNPQTTVAFDLPAAGRAEVRVYSLRGELVAVLGGGTYAAGRHQEIWRGSDQQGRDVPSGSYFARLYVDGHARGAVTKMSLVR